MAGKERKAGKKTRERLEEEGAPEELWNKPDLTMREAQEWLSENVDEEEDEEPWPAPPTHDEVTGKEVLLIQPDEVQSQVVGESFYKENLEWLKQRLPGGDGVHYGWAVFIPEPENQHDKFAVAVYIGKAKVGFLPKEIATVAQGHILNAFHQSGRIYCCAAKVLTSRGGYTGVSLMCDTTLFPREEPTSRRSPLLPASTSQPVGCSSLIAVSFLLVPLIFGLCCFVSVARQSNRPVAQERSQSASIQIAQNTTTQPSPAQVALNTNIYIVEEEMSIWDKPGLDRSKQLVFDGPFALAVLEQVDYGSDVWLRVSAAKSRSAKTQGYVFLGSFAMTDKREVTQAEAMAFVEARP